MDSDLVDIFNISRKRHKGVRPAQELLRQHRKPIIDKVAYWSGVQRPIVKRLLEAIYRTEFTVYTTALSMNYLIGGKFIHP
jgi:hypothetical protein